MRAGKVSNIFLHILFVIMAACCVLPILLVISVSLSDNSSIVEYGYTLFPKTWSLESYKFIFEDATTIIRAYGVTIFTTVIGAFFSTLFIALYAYPLSRPDFLFKKHFTIYIFFTMLFSGGTVSWYVVCTTVFHLSNTIWALIIPNLMSAWYVIMMRTFFQTSVPMEMIEAGKIDGANEFLIFFRLVIPISLPGIATIALFKTLAYWNDWWLSIMFIIDPKLYNLQFLLQRMMQNIQMLNENAQYMADGAAELMKIPKEGARMALCVVAMGPILIVYPFFQKYFIQGLTVGSIKG